MYELDVVEEGRVVSRRRLLRAETVVGGHAACDVHLTSWSEPEQVVLRWTGRGIEVFGASERLRYGGRAARDGLLWQPGRALVLGETRLELRALVSRTATHEADVKIAEELQLRAGAAVVALRTDRSTVIGASHADLNVVHGSVAARHAKVEWRGGGYYVVDLGSGRETLVNGRVVAPGATGARLRVGDQVTCGVCVLDLELRSEVLDHGLIGESEAWRAVRAQIAAVAEHAVVSVVGEPGTGKALVAHALHAVSGRPGEMLPLNGASLMPGTSRSAIFGHKKGAFSDAIKDRLGAIGVAEDGTIVVSETGGIDLEVQAQLLRVLDAREAMKVGGPAAEMIRASFVFCVDPKFLPDMRWDFRARLGEHQIRLPPLRARGEDVILIAEQRLASLDRRLSLSVGAKKALRAHRWPGNVRELLNVIERAVRRAPAGVEVLEEKDLRWLDTPQYAKPAGGPHSDALRAHGGNLSAAAKSMGLSRYLFRKGLKSEGQSAGELRVSLKAERAEDLRRVVVEEGGFAAAARKLGMSDRGVSEAVGALVEEISRESIEMRLQMNAGNVAVVAEDLGLTERALRRRMRLLQVFGGAPKGPLGWLVIEGRRGSHREAVHALGFSVGTRGDNEVILEEGPAQLAMVVQRGARLGLRVRGGPGVHAAGGLLLHARAIDLDVGEVVRVGETRLRLESEAELAPPAEQPAEQAVLRVGDKTFAVDPKGSVTVGADANLCDVVVDDPHVSGRHLRVFEAGGRWHVRDLNSKNGTYVRGELHSAGAVRVPAPIRIGGAELQLEWARPKVWKRTYGFVGESEPMQKVYKVLGNAGHGRTALVTGETGTGKELAARALHEIWGGGPWVPVNCGGVSDELLLNELMGHVRGAFTGAKEDKLGLIPQAEGGTLFLDEIGDMSPQLQVQLMGVVSDGAYTPAGVDLRRTANIRVVAATNRDLGAMMQAGTFNDSLYYRFGWYLQLPPLRDRGPADLFALAEYLLDGMGGWRLEADAFELLQGRMWSRNVRELRNVLQAAATLANQEGDTEVGQDVLRRALQREAASTTL